MTTATAAIKPPPIRGSVPADYHGPLYYRLQHLGDSARKPLMQLINFDDRKVVRKLCQVHEISAALRKDPTLCDANGDLLPEWRTPITGKLKAGANKSWDEFSITGLTLVSQRIKDVVEAAALNVHYFVPLDIEDREGGNLRVYAFFCGVLRRRSPLALEANGIPYTLSDKGEPVFRTPDWMINSDRFVYLDASVVDGAPLLESGLGLLFSRELMERLGDIMPKGTVFVPMGLA